MPTFNLIDDPWIPVRWRETVGKPPLVGLHQAFTEADRIIDLSATPHGRIALIRLLVCIAQAAKGAPSNRDAWPGFGDDLVPTVTDYLDRPDVASRFELFGDDPRFLQTSVQPKGDPVPVSKLFPHLATGNNPTVFDHGGGSERAEPPAALALALLVFQNFYPLYGAGYKGKGPCVDANMLHLLLRGETLKDWIRLNCLDAETVSRQFPGGFGRPLWEIDETDPAFATNATETYLGRLVPRHRNLRLNDDCTGFYLSKESLSYPTFEAAIEPTATVIVRKKGKETYRALLPAYLDRSIWRDLHSMCALRVADGDERAAPLVLQSHVTEIEDSDNPAARIWTGALVTDLKAKIRDTVESSFTVPTRLLNSLEGQLEYQDGVAVAEDLSRRLYGAVKAYASAMKHESPPTEAAQRHYWNALDRESDVLLHLVGHPEDRGPHKFGEGPKEEADDWTRTVRRALANAYGAVCPRQTPRQIEAYAAGLRVLYPQPKKKKKKRAA